MFTANPFTDSLNLYSDARFTVIQLTVYILSIYRDSLDLYSDARLTVIQLSVYS